MKKIKKTPTYIHKQEWLKENTTLYSLRFNNITQKKYIDKLNSVENKKDYIISLIEKDLKGE